MEKKDKKRLETRLVEYYERFSEKDRMFEGVGQLEFTRTKEIINRYLQPSPAVIFDIGGAAGAYSLWLAREGYTVHLVDPVPAHINQANHSSRMQPRYPIESCCLGDARCLDFPDNSADALLLFGPMYHLTDLSQRRLALMEASRVVRPGGTIFVAAISRFASFLDGLIHAFLDDHAFAEIVKQDLADGQHRNPTGNSLYFTDSFFHRPDELREEIEYTGLRCQKILPVESIGGLLQNLEEHWSDDERRARLLEALRWIEGEPALLGASQHILAVATKLAK